MCLEQLRRIVMLDSRLWAQNACYAMLCVGIGQPVGSAGPRSAEMRASAAGAWRLAARAPHTHTHTGGRSAASPRASDFAPADVKNTARGAERLWSTAEVRSWLGVAGRSSPQGAADGGRPWPARSLLRRNLLRNKGAQCARYSALSLLRFCPRGQFWRSRPGTGGSVRVLRMAAPGEEPW